ncbi:citrate synthase family protein [Actinoplanes sp. NPDC051513]|uniref:citrate synthase family protein n=1 Tax=Actinoplanes sp. NPDC051513 TaxID=3363908 RepID=UPI00378CFD41
MSPEPHLLSTDEVAARLGIKPTTVYAYVSRGMLPSIRNAEGKGSLFAKPDVDAFVARRRRPTTPAIQTGITLIKDGGLYYRGQDASLLAGSASFESVATLLWTGEREHVDLVPSAELKNLAVATVQPLPTGARTTDRLRVIVAAAAAADPLRFDTTPAAVIATARTLLATMVAALPYAQGVTTGEVLRREQGTVSLAELLWPRLTLRDPDPGPSASPSNDAGPGTGIRTGAHKTLNAALILLADHDIAASTLAARVAASTRAHPYAVVSAGLAALDGPLHGAASGLAYALLKDAMATGDPVTTIAARLRADGMIPGFGHPLYPDGDPRATTLMAMLDEGPVRDTATRLAKAVRDRSGTQPNIDFALAALTLQHDMPADAGEAIFAVARTAGWLAHALEEYSDRPSRFRPVGQYSGRIPSAG